MKYHYRRLPALVACAMMVAWQTIPGVACLVYCTQDAAQVDSTIDCSECATCCGTPARETTPDSPETPGGCNCDDCQAPCCLQVVSDEENPRQSQVQVAAPLFVHSAALAGWHVPLAHRPPEPSDRAAAFPTLHLYRLHCSLLR